MEKNVDEPQQVWRNDEIKARERAREKDIMDGDQNTSYFYAMEKKEEEADCCSGGSIW
jgi:hypothetical protein